MDLLLLVAVSCCCYCCALLLVGLLRRFQRPLRDVHRLLLVIAHPDDESMFFVPSILGLLSHDAVDVYILCLSCGDQAGLGRVRKQELRRAIACLGLAPEALTIVEHSRLPDQMGLVWDREVISSIVLRQVETLDIDCVLTFDEHGVSGHSNHTSLFHAVQSLYSRGVLPTNTQVFVLETVNLFRKYSSMCDVPLSLLSSNFSYISTWRDVVVAHRAMHCHWSQLVWFRRLYLLFSRYLVVNTVRRIAIQPRYYRYKTS